MLMQSRHYWLEGKVQGVGYRMYAMHEAKNLKLLGWVKNTSDGRVELVAYGNPQKLDILQKRLQLGPPYANVTKLSVSEHPEEDFNDFIIR